MDGSRRKIAFAFKATIIIFCCYHKNAVLYFLQVNKDTRLKETFNPRFTSQLEVQTLLLEPLGYKNIKKGELKMRFLLAPYVENHKVDKRTWKHNSDMFAKLIGCVSFWNSGRLTLSDGAFQFVPLARINRAGIDVYYAIQDTPQIAFFIRRNYIAVPLNKKCFARMNISEYRNFVAKKCPRLERECAKAHSS